MLKQLRQRIVQSLWTAYRQRNLQMQQLEQALYQCGIKQLILDHFAIIDLPGPHSGISPLRAIFTALGFTERGNGYLAEKQNDFVWMAENDSDENAAHDVLPQVVIADFRLEEMPTHIANIIRKYAAYATPFDLSLFNQPVLHILEPALFSYFKGRSWPLPTLHEFKTIQEFNELLAWVLVFGRQPNHFTLSIHLLNYFDSLTAFHQFIKEKTPFSLNEDGGLIKGDEKIGIAQGSTRGIKEKIPLQDGLIDIPTSFIEFVWRYPKYSATNKSSRQWKDYFTGFVANHADYVIESLYDKS